MYGASDDSSLARTRNPSLDAGAMPAGTHMAAYQGLHAGAEPAAVHFHRESTPDSSSSGAALAPAPAKLAAPLPVTPHKDVLIPIRAQGTGGASPHDFIPPSDATQDDPWTWLDYIPVPYGVAAPPAMVDTARYQLGEELKKRSAAERATNTQRDAWIQSLSAQEVLPPRKSKLNFLRRLLGELIGTLILVFVHTTAGVKGNQGVLSAEGVAVVDGITLTALILSLGEVCGAHFNPCITLAFALRNMFTWVWVIPYWIAQFTGAIIGASIVRGFYQGDAWLGSNSVAPGNRFTHESVMLFEAMITAMLIFVVLSVTQSGGISGLNASIAVGSVIAFGIALANMINGGSMNPFRSLGPAIVNGPIDEVWPQIAGPFIGMAIAVILTLVFSKRNNSKKAAKTAMGFGVHEA